VPLPPPKDGDAARADVLPNVEEPAVLPPPKRLVVCAGLLLLFPKRPPLGLEVLVCPKAEAPVLPPNVKLKDGALFLSSAMCAVVAIVRNLQ
jgi:hypothetical protein